MPHSKFFLTSGSILAALGVVLGAFGAHALKNKISADYLQVFETGVKYQMYHAIALILISFAPLKFQSASLNYSGLFLFIGIILFSGSLYLLACREILGIENFKSILGPLTPLGGLCLITGWIFLIITSIKSS